ncbi:PPM-type phosphatase domain-containing protein [Mycena indigotica]|uniref:PPM-type phosphatase domain-containing protein n=1 Tax=Mycena indigotica TaxID=2126181 RepID=A0A8H6TA66_9AGAR|nr:PPM-type phosphatase domain-containing protein [Mycena indigotica]KAF7315005.1 PPM-type phosphatase domain-containing protein [Mycena indigotica]
MSRLVRSARDRWGRLSRTSRFLIGTSSIGYLFYLWNKRDKQPSTKPVSLRKPAKGIFRVDSVGLGASMPFEQASSVWIETGKHEWFLSGVYAGYWGEGSATILGSQLLKSLNASLITLYSRSKQPDNRRVYQSFITAFTGLDDTLIKPVKILLKDDSAEGMRKNLAAILFGISYPGSGALATFFDSAVQRFHVALVGDSRAVLGRRRKTDDGKIMYDVHVLSEDQTVNNPQEVARLLAAHPNEPELLDRLFRDCGRKITRAFGDGMMKWSRDFQIWLRQNTLSDEPSPFCLTPPYLSAEPEVTTTDIHPGDFVILASRGLWNSLTNEEVVGLVGLWLDGDRHNKNVDILDKTGGHRTFERDSLPVILTDNGSESHYRRWPAAKKVFVNMEENAAVHLVKNAIGGADLDLVKALMKTHVPRAAQFHDDIYVCLDAAYKYTPMNSEYWHNLWPFFSSTTGTELQLIRQAIISFQIAGSG